MKNTDKLKAANFLDLYADDMHGSYTLAGKRKGDSRVWAQDQESQRARVDHDEMRRLAGELREDAGVRT